MSQSSAVSMLAAASNSTAVLACGVQMEDEDGVQGGDDVLDELLVAQRSLVAAQLFGASSEDEHVAAKVLAQAINRVSALTNAENLYDCVSQGTSNAGNLSDCDSEMRDSDAAGMAGSDEGRAEAGGAVAASTECDGRNVLHKICRNLPKSGIREKLAAVREEDPLLFNRFLGERDNYGFTPLLYGARALSMDWVSDEDFSSGLHIFGELLFTNSELASSKVEQDTRVHEGDKHNGRSALGFFCSMKRGSRIKEVLNLLKALPATNYQRILNHADASGATPADLVLRRIISICQ